MQGGIGGQRHRRRSVVCRVSVRSSHQIRPAYPRHARRTAPPQPQLGPKGKKPGTVKTRVLGTSSHTIRSVRKTLADTFSNSSNRIDRLSDNANLGCTSVLSFRLDKQRGFVNGALAEVRESLDGNAVFTARLVGTGNMVLVHPMKDADGGQFLPCCYGYATTIRRAQGADMYHGCVYFNQKKRAAARGYGYVLLF